MTEEKKVNGNTKLGADLALKRKTISEESYKAVLAGDISLQEAKDLGRNVGPTGPAVRVNKDDRTRLCMCGCGKSTRGRFAIGHDARVKGWIIRAVREGTVDKLTDEQREYGEERDLFRLTRERMAAEEDRKKAAKNK